MSFESRREVAFDKKKQGVVRTPAPIPVKVDSGLAKLVAKNDKEVWGERTPDLSVAGSVKDSGKTGEGSGANGVWESSRVSGKKPRELKDPTCQEYSAELTRRKALAKDLIAATNTAIDALTALVNEKIESLKRY
ncbi:hypothetical protein HDU76_002665, partial [Blyttiomyces sp. JEL0837]